MSLALFGIVPAHSDARKQRVPVREQRRQYVDVYFLAKQMGTSVKMIEDHYGH